MRQEMRASAKSKNMRQKHMRSARATSTYAQHTHTRSSTHAQRINIPRRCLGGNIGEAVEEAPPIIDCVKRTFTKHIQDLEVQNDFVAQNEMNQDGKPKVNSP